jgi:peroxiredoxin
MHRLKSLFVSTYLTALMVALVWAGLHLVREPENLAYSGVVLASGAPLAFFARLFLAPVARISTNLNWIPVAGAAGTLVALVNGGIGLPAAVALANGVVLALVYIHWYSRFGARNTPALLAGNLLPELTLKTLDGRALSTQDLTQKSALWIFYRGNWCPLCMAQIREVAAEYRRLHERGVEVYLISPQSQDHCRSLSLRFDAPMQFLRDRDNQAAARLSVLAEGGLPLGMQALGYESDVPMPTVFITAPGGRIVYSDLTDNYRVRPEPAEFMAALDRAGL